MSADAAVRAGLEQGLAAYEAAQAAYDALIDGCHRITPEYLQQEAALEAARDAALCALPARSELARMLLSALAAQAEAGAKDVEELKEALDRAGRNAHPWYGPCDALGEAGECAECQWVERQRMAAQVRHIKGGGRYQVEGVAFVQAARPVVEGELVVVYSDAQGKWHARPEEEFEGRFMPEGDWRVRNAAALAAAEEVGK